MAKRKWTRQEVLEHLARWGGGRDEHSVRALMWNRCEPGSPSEAVVYSYFGSWPVALLAAGLRDPEAQAPGSISERVGFWTR